MSHIEKQTDTIKDVIFDAVELKPQLNLLSTDMHNNTEAQKVRELKTDSESSFALYADLLLLFPAFP